MQTIFIIDDDPRLSQVLARRFATKTEFNVHCFASASEAMHHWQTGVYAILLDMMLQDETGLDFIEQLAARFCPRHLIVMTGYASIPTTVRAIKSGATDYLTKPVSFQTILQRLGVVSAADETESLTPMTPAQAEWEHIQRTLHDHENNISATAKALGMHRRTLQRKLQKMSPGK